MYEVIKTLKKKEADLVEQLRKVRMGISALQELCEHNWVYNGHDSHNTHYICTHCGAEKT